MRTMRIWTFEDRRAPFVGVFRRSAINAGYDVRLISPTIEPPGFTQLKTHYRHLSPNPQQFELASFRRWFEIAAEVTPDERFVQADSDLVVQTAFSDLPVELRDAEAMVGSRGAADNVLEDGISGGFSLWTGRQLNQFCDYVVAAYESRIDSLSNLHARKVAEGNPRASISDMTLLYQWVQDDGVPFVNSNRVISGQYVDHNFSMVGCLGTRFRSAFGRKALRFAPDGFWLATREGASVRPSSLHLGGRYKIMASDIETGNRTGLTLKSLYILGGRTARGLLGRVGISR